MVTSQLIFHSSLLYALIDCSVTHCFITSGIVERIGLEPTLVSQISTDMSNEDKVHSNHFLIREAISLRD